MAYIFFFLQYVMSCEYTYTLNVNFIFFNLSICLFALMLNIISTQQVIGDIIKNQYSF